MDDTINSLVAQLTEAVNALPDKNLKDKLLPLLESINALLPKTPSSLSNNQIPDTGLNISSPKRGANPSSFMESGRGV